MNTLKNTIIFLKKHLIIMISCSLVLTFSMSFYLIAIINLVSFANVTWAGCRIVKNNIGGLQYAFGIGPLIYFFGMLTGILYNLFFYDFVHGHDFITYLGGVLISYILFGLIYGFLSFLGGYFCKRKCNEFDEIIK